MFGNLTRGQAVAYFQRGDVPQPNNLELVHLMIALVKAEGRSAVALVHVFEEIYDRSDRRRNLDFDMTIEFGRTYELNGTTQRLPTKSRLAERNVRHTVSDT